MSHVKALQAVAGDHKLLLAAASQSWDRRILGADSFLPPGHHAKRFPSLDSSAQLIALPRQVSMPGGFLYLSVPEHCNSMLT